MFKLPRKDTCDIITKSAHVKAFSKQPGYFMQKTNRVGLYYFRPIAFKLNGGVMYQLFVKLTSNHQSIQINGSIHVITKSNW